ncbi:peptidoglycan-binding domain-containing protein [Streptomyces orinoci]|uniref:Peptidoglycan-binding domain-containing protein n=1 Tax=Streptomyces orinoci TaxID=67339 RepID=A0ABV3JUZ3_STRON|nr:peptidoglycan-binding domain-containing protein [Streptomyces orinoci]
MFRRIAVAGAAALLSTIGAVGAAHAAPAGHPYKCDWLSNEPEISLGDGNGPNANDQVTWAVKAAQCELDSVMDRHVAVDGWFGTGTKNAVIAFQRYCAKLPADGIVGPNTWNKLDTWWQNGWDCHH